MIGVEIGALTVHVGLRLILPVLLRLVDAVVAVIVRRLVPVDGLD